MFVSGKHHHRSSQHQNLLEPSEIEWKSYENGWARCRSLIFYSPKINHQQRFSIPLKRIQRIKVISWLKVGYTLNNQVPRQCISVSSLVDHDLLFWCFFSFQKAILSSLGTMSSGWQNKYFSFKLKIWPKHQLVL